MWNIKLLRCSRIDNSTSLFNPYTTHSLPWKNYNSLQFIVLRHLTTMLYNTHWFQSHLLFALKSGFWGSLTIYLFLGAGWISILPLSITPWGLLNGVCSPICWAASSKSHIDDSLPFQCGSDSGLDPVPSTCPWLTPSYSKDPSILCSGLVLGTVCCWLTDWTPTSPLICTMFLLYLVFERHKYVQYTNMQCKMCSSLTNNINMIIKKQNKHQHLYKP